MDRENIIRMAREAGWDMEWGGTTVEQVMAFAALVAAEEREACAKAVERASFIATPITDFLAAHIRARGDA